MEQINYKNRTEQVRDLIANADINTEKYAVDILNPGRKNASFVGYYVSPDGMKTLMIRVPLNTDGVACNIKRWLGVFGKTKTPCAAPNPEQAPADVGMGKIIAPINTESLVPADNKSRGALKRDQTLDKQPVAWILLEQHCRAVDDCEDVPVLCFASEISETELNKYIESGRATPLYTKHGAAS
ncbi:MAG: hypothetical protein ACJAYB_000030 [Psychromonas sp.]|jgi:hypothetical protein